MLTNSNKKRRQTSQSPDRNLEPALKRRRIDGVQPRELKSDELAPLRNLEELLGPHTVCMICERNISRSIKVKDMTNTAETIIFCLDCLCRGKTREDLNHVASCDYFIYDNLGFPLIHEGWTASETLRLM